MDLETMRPNPAWDPVAHEDAVDVLAAYATAVTIRVWGADWCPHCRRYLPDFAAALEAAGIPDDRVEIVAVDREKQGPGVEEFGIEYVPTIVLSVADEEVARFVEEGPVPPAVALAEALSEREGA